jgi:hypothetical protein
MLGPVDQALQLVLRPPLVPRRLQPAHLVEVLSQPVVERWQHELPEPHAALRTSVLYDWTTRRPGQGRV